MLDLSTVMVQCTMCNAETERSLHNLMEVNAELQAENKNFKQTLSAAMQEWDEVIKEQQGEIERLSAHTPGLTYEQQYLIDIVGQLVAVLRLKPDTLPRGYAELIRAYDKCEGKMAS